MKTLTIIPTIPLRPLALTRALRPPTLALTLIALLAIAAIACGEPSVSEQIAATQTAATRTAPTASPASAPTTSPSQPAAPVRTEPITALNSDRPRAGVDTRRFRIPGFTGAPTDDVAPFTDIAPQALGDNASVANDLTGVAIFDYDRDGDMDFYITQSRDNPNLLFRNDGDLNFTEVAEDAHAHATASNSTGAVACDLDNDGYQDLYISAQGIVGDGLDFQDAAQDRALHDAISDRLLRNDGDGTFTDITQAAFGAHANVRTGTSPACADIDRDGYTDIFVANRSDLDAVHPGVPTSGNGNVLYRNNGDLTFTEIGSEAGVRGEQVVTWATMFFDFDDDGDPDLWTADDGGPVKIYRNDSDDEGIRFISVERPMGLDKRGNWMGFALGDYDGDADLDIFVTNIGYHPKTRPLPFESASGDCSGEQLYAISTCAHYLLRNDGTTLVPRLGEVGFFPDVAAAVPIEPSRVMPPDSLDPVKIWLDWRVPTGLAAYDFGFGAAFFDYENDGDQDLYWTGSALGRGESPDGKWFPAAGRMLRGDGRGSFQDITVEANLLNIKGVDYSNLNPADPDFDRAAQRLDTAYHENGKGLAKGDLNGDGYIDLIATNSAGPIFTGNGDELDFERGPTFVWLNGGGDDNWLTLRLKGRMAVDGTGSNADAIGARVFLTAMDEQGNPRTQTADVTAGASFLSMSSLDLHFGIADADIIDEVTIFWPSGIRQLIRNIPPNQTLEITEPTLP